MSTLWKALCSTETELVRDRIAISAPVCNSVFGWVADDADELWDGTLSQILGYDPYGNRVATGAQV